MSWILGISGVLCFIYFAAILIFSGPGTSFAFIWLAMALVLGAAASGRLVERLSAEGSRQDILPGLNILLCYDP